MNGFKQFTEFWNGKRLDDLTSAQVSALEFGQAAWNSGIEEAKKVAIFNLKQLRGLSDQTTEERVIAALDALKSTEIETNK